MTAVWWSLALVVVVAHVATAKELYLQWDYPAEAVEQISLFTIYLRPAGQSYNYDQPSTPYGRETREARCNDLPLAIQGQWFAVLRAVGTNGKYSESSNEVSFWWERGKGCVLQESPSPSQTPGQPPVVELPPPTPVPTPPHASDPPPKPTPWTSYIPPPPPTVVAPEAKTPSKANSQWITEQCVWRRDSDCSE